MSRNPPCACGCGKRVDIKTQRHIKDLDTGNVYFIKHFKKIHGNPANYIKSQPNQAQAVIAAATPMIEKGAQLAVQAIQRRGIARTAKDIAQTATGVKAAVGEKAAKNIGQPLKRKNAEKLAKKLEAGGYSVIIGPDGKKRWIVQIENPEGISRWAFTQARQEIACPRCGAATGEYCKRPSGSQASEPHVERMKAYHDRIGREEYKRRHSVQGDFGVHQLQNPVPRGWEVIDSGGRQVSGPFETEQAGWDYVAGHGGPDALSVEPIEGMYANPEEEDVEEFVAKYYPPSAPGELENPRRNQYAPDIEEVTETGIHLTPEGVENLRKFYTLKRKDVGKHAIRAFGRAWPVANFIGQVLLRDVGKRVYLVPCEDPRALGILQVDNDEQRARRLGRKNPADMMDVEGMHMARLMLGKQNPEEPAPAQPAAPPPPATTLAETQARINEIMARMQRGEITGEVGIAQIRELVAGTPPDTAPARPRRRTRVIQVPPGGGLTLPVPLPPPEEMERIIREVEAQTAQITDPVAREAEMRRILTERGGQLGQMFQGPHGPYHIAYTQLKPAVVKIVRDFIVKARPWRGTAEEKQQKFEAVIKKLARHYNIRPPTVHISDPEHAMGSGFYNQETNHIELPHYSVVTLLHEFKHAMQHLTNQPQNEEVARGWSLSLFYKAAPKHFKRAVERAIIFFITPADITDRPESMLFAFAESPSPALPILAPLKARLEEMGYRTELRDGMAKLRRDGQPEAAKLLYTNAPGFVVDRALKYHMRVPDDTYRGEVDQALMRIEANPRKVVYVVKCPKCGKVQEASAQFIGGVSQPLVHDCRECDFSLHEEHVLSSHYENPRRKGKAFVRGRFEIRPSGRYIREMVDRKTEFDKRSFKTVRRGRSGHAVVIGCPAGQWDPTTKRCGVGTKAQSILHPLSEAKRYGFAPQEMVANGVPMAPPPEVIEVLENPDPYYYSSEAENVSPEAVGKGAGAAAEIASMAATGAAMGSVVPGVGTAIGAGAGAGAAVAKQAYDVLKERKRKKAEVAAASQKTAENPEPPQALIEARDLM